MFPPGGFMPPGGVPGMPPPGMPPGGVPGMPMMGPGGQMMAPPVAMMPDGTFSGQMMGQMMAPPVAMMPDGTSSGQMMGPPSGPMMPPGGMGPPGGMFGQVMQGGFAAPPGAVTLQGPPRCARTDDHTCQLQVPMSSQQLVPPAGYGGAPGSQQPSPRSPIPVDDDLSSQSVKALVAIAAARGVDVSTCREKSEIVAALRAPAAGGEPGQLRQTTTQDDAPTSPQRSHVDRRGKRRTTLALKPPVSAIITECEQPNDALPTPAFIVKPKLQPLTAGSDYKVMERTDNVQSTGFPLYVRIEGRIALGYDTTGDGYVDALDTKGDGILDATLLIDTSGEETLFAKLDAEDQAIELKAAEIFDAIDKNSRGQISKFDMVSAMKRDTSIDKFLCKEVPGMNAFDDATGRSFEAVEAVFAAIGGGAPRVHKEVFVEFFVDQATQNDEALQLFNKMDTDRSGMVSKHEIMMSVLTHTDKEIAKLIFPADALPDSVSEDVWDKVDEFFANLSGGKKWVFYEDFAAFYQIQQNPQIAREIPKRKKQERINKRVLIIGPGFGRELNPMQAALVQRSGYQVQWALDIPNPEIPGFDIGRYLPQLEHTIMQFQPHLVCCASKGWHYLAALVGKPREFACLMINVNPKIRTLPKGMNWVVAAGSNDETYPIDRTRAEATMASADYNRAFLYWSPNSGCVNGGYARYGDRHNMESLIHYDLLPRLMDAALSSCPENDIVFSWRDRLGQGRARAEEYLSGDPGEWVKKWVNCPGKKNCSKTADKILHEVPVGSEEYKAVLNMFYGEPAEPAMYCQKSSGGQCFAKSKVVKIDRVQNGPLMKGFQSYYDKLKDVFEGPAPNGMNIEFAPNVHTRWVFHGTDAYEAIINDPITGFQPLAAGARLGSLWGSGTYFARDAKYVVESNFCRLEEDNLCRMMVVLACTGIPCMGAGEQKGILPYRNGQAPFKYNSTVDSLSSPEIFITHQPSAAYPAYIITYATGPEWS